MFEGLTGRFQKLFQRLRGHGVFTDALLREANAELRQTLLEADVHHAVVDSLLARVAEATVGIELLKNVAPADQYLKIVHEALTEVLGGTTTKLNFGGRQPVVMMIVGVQGGGKTTSIAKLALWCQQHGRRPLLVPADRARPAAVEQLHALGREWNLAVTTSTDPSPLRVVEAALDQARAELFDTVLIDTAGRLHIDDALMTELVAIRDLAQPAQTLLVVDAMAGQQGLITAQGFHAKTPLTGVIMSKADGDARGGVALSCRAVLGVPIFFAGIGEKVDAFEPFHPERIASRILDLGDLATLVEKVQATATHEPTLERVKKLAQGRFTLEDFREQLREVGKMGQLEGLLKMLPGAGRILPKIDMAQVQADLKKKQAVIDSMTLQERANIRILNGNRRKRIAAGSGTTVTDVNRLIKEFEMMQKMVKKGSGRGMGLAGLQSSPELSHLLRR